MIVLSSISCDDIVWEVEPTCCDGSGRYFIELPYDTVLGDTVYATDGNCYRALSTSAASPTITLGDPTIYTDCVDCVAAHPCPTTTTTTTLLTCEIWNWEAAGLNDSGLEYTNCDNVFTVIPVIDITNNSGAICVYPGTTPVWNPGPSLGSHILGTNSIPCGTPATTTTTTTVV